MTTRPIRRPSVNNSNTNNENYNSSEEIINTNNEDYSSDSIVDQSARYQELKKKQLIIQKERTKREFEYEHAKKQLKSCQEEASALGVNSIEELEELIKNKEQEEKQILDNFENDLKKEEAALKQIEENLNN